jgi:hypothetical protein
LSWICSSAITIKVVVWFAHEPDLVVLGVVRLLAAVKTEFFWLPVAINGCATDEVVVSGECVAPIASLKGEWITIVVIVFAVCWGALTCFFHTALAWFHAVSLRFVHNFSQLDAHQINVSVTVAASAQSHLHLLSVWFNGVVDQFLWVDHSTARIAILEGLVNLGIGDTISVAVPRARVRLRAQVWMRAEVFTSHCLPESISFHCASAFRAAFSHVIPFC